MAIFKLALLIGAANAQRPTEGGLFSFSSDDVIEIYDIESIRIHYSTLGPNQTLLTDSDNSGVPDYVELVGETARSVMTHFSTLGFFLPLTEEEMGLNALGGSTAYDWYLVDFGGSSDGQFGVDACLGEQCSGFMVMENDFYGYGYPSREEAVRTLVSHEYFHSIQAAYSANQPDWISEGTAVWAEHSFDPSLQDFFWLCSSYLSDTGRSINRPPVGAISGFSYGTGLFYTFLAERFDEAIMVTLQEQLFDPAVDDFSAIIDSIELEGGTLGTEWVEFSEWNLATDFRAGEVQSYSFASELFGLEAEFEGDVIKEDHRFYPLASSYFRLTHYGGALQFVSFEETDGIQMSLHPVLEGWDGKVGDPIERWEVDGVMTLNWELPEGGYWLIGSYPENATQSEKFEFCLGPDADCYLPQGSDTGISENETSPKSQGCESLPLQSRLWVLAPLFLWYRRHSSGVFHVSIVAES